MNKSFTLIEILIVIVVIGTISSFILIGTNSITNSANITKSKAFSNSLRNSLLINLKGEWNFEGPTSIDQDATISDIQDTWGGNNTGITIYGPPKVKGENDCASEKCLAFNGSTDYVYCGTGGVSLDISSGESITLESWVKLGSLGKLHTIIAKWQPWIFFIGSNNKQYFYIRSGASDYGVYSNTALSSNKWYHLAVSYFRLERKAVFYLNGKTDGAPIFTVDINGETGSRFSIAGYGNVNTILNGLIDDIKIYNQGISSSVIKENYYSGLNRLFKNNQISLNEFNQRLTEFKSNLANNE